MVVVITIIQKNYSATYKLFYLSAQRALYNTPHLTSLEVTAVVICHYVSKTELNL